MGNRKGPCTSRGLCIFFFATVANDGFVVKYVLGVKQDGPKNEPADESTVHAVDYFLWRS